VLLTRRGRASFDFGARNGDPFFSYFFSVSKIYIFNFSSCRGKCDELFTMHEEPDEDELLLVSGDSFQSSFARALAQASVRRGNAVTRRDELQVATLHEEPTDDTSLCTNDASWQLKEVRISISLLIE
jgi:hypothetical protein